MSKKFVALTETQIIENLKASGDASQGVLDSLQTILASAIYHSYKTGQLHIANRVINTVNASPSFMSGTKKAIMAFLEEFLPFARKAKEGENPNFPLLMKRGNNVFSEYEAEQVIKNLPLFYKWKKENSPKAPKSFNAESQITALINRSLKAEVDGKNSLILASLQSFLPLILAGKLLSEVTTAEVTTAEVTTDEIGLIKSITKTPAKRTTAKRTTAKLAA